MSENVGPVTLDELTEQIREIALQVSAAQDRVEEREFVAATHDAVERVSQRYRDYYASLSEGDKLKVERSLGRRLLDVKRLASLLPRVGNLGSTPDRQVKGASEVGERRITGVSWGAGSRLASAGGTARYKVGGDIEAWCTPCGGLTEHSIVALVGDEPKQVVCQSCNGRHGYRTTPARKTGSTSDTMPAVTATTGGGQGQRREDVKAAELRALAAEIAQATEVRSFDPKQRYRPGDIIAHPEFGRGKVETVLRSSLLVRFSIGGLKSLMLN
jgi:hypothetical protein